ncbi:hypothetical protein BN133_3905 [Cronobacter dublinensis 582]|nr:hypothetical protein BN133_3905 [Cronobacter dublinensis 582]
MTRFAAADGKADPAGSHQAALFLLFKLPVRVGIGGRHDIHVFTGAQCDVTVACHRRAFDEQIFTRLQRDVIAAQQRARFARGALLRDRVRGGFLEEAFLGFGFFFVVVIALGGGREVNIAPRRHADIPFGDGLRRVGIHITPGDNDRIPATRQLRALLAHGLVNSGFLLRAVAVACSGGLRLQVHITASLHTDIIFRRQSRRTGVDVPACAQRQVIASGNGRAIEPGTVRFAFPVAAVFAGVQRVEIEIAACREGCAAACFDITCRHAEVITGFDAEIAACAKGAALVGHRRAAGIGVIPEARLPVSVVYLVGIHRDVAPGVHQQIAAGGEIRARDGDVFTGLQGQAVLRANRRRAAERGVFQHDAAVLTARVNAGLFGKRDVINAAVGALQRHGFPADGRADVIDIANGAEVQAAARFHQAVIEVADAVPAVELEILSGQ